MDKNDRRLILLFSLILVVIPVVVFPNRLGLPLAGSSAVNMLYELVFYGFIYFLFNRNTALTALMIGAAMTLVYRMAIGAVFGLMVIIMYGLDSTIAFSLGMTKYLPAVLLHVVAAPFIMRPVYLQMSQQMPGDRKSRGAIGEKSIQSPARHSEPYKAVPKMAGTESFPGIARPAADKGSARPVAEGSAPVYSSDENPFEQAVEYVGESGAVQLVVLVDEEGLPLANFNRSSEELDLWAPLAVVLRQANRSVLERYGKTDQLDKIDMVTKHFRIIIRRIEHLMLMVLAEKDIDETIHIRIAQATDMIRKYMNERYSPAMFARVEEHYVSNS